MRHKHKWLARRTIWPYVDGYGVYCAGCRTVLDTGLSKPDAEARAKELNHARS